jgi:hypothetical protein
LKSPAEAQFVGVTEMDRGLRVDASLISIMIIVLISSGLVVFSFAREKIDSPVVVLKNIHPTKLYSQASVTTRDRMDFSLSLAAREDVETLEIQYTTLVQVNPVFVDPNQTLEGTVGEIAEGIAPIRALIQETSNDLVPHDVLEAEGSVKNLSYEGLFYDFPLLRLYADPAISGTVYTSYLVFHNATHVTYFEGISDFFINRLGGYVEVELPEGDEMKSSIESLRIRRDDNVTSYSSADDAPAGWKDIEDTPPFGRVVFREVKKHETFSIDFTIEIPRRPQKMAAQVVRIYADGELVDMAVNLME